MKNNFITFVEINRKNLKHNISLLKSKTKNANKIIAVVKKNAYGHGIYEISKIIANQVEMLAVASIEEAISLREKGIKKPILILSYIYPDEKIFNEIIKYNLIPTISSLEELKVLSNTSKEKKTNFHLKIDTGMGRSGLLPEEILDFLEIYQRKRNLSLQGIFTHLSSAYFDPKYTKQQIDIFNEILTKIKKANFNPTYIHVANSAATFLYPFTHYNTIRPGIAIYGLSPFERKRKIDLRPILSWKTKIVLLRKIKKGKKISYGQTFTTKRDSLIATIPVGYADGYSRDLSNKAEVIINGRKAPVVGRVTMDMTMVDVTGLKVQLGDEVILIGSKDGENVSVDEIAKLSNTINYEVVTRINPNIPRLYS